MEKIALREAAVVTGFDCYFLMFPLGREDILVSEWIVRFSEDQRYLFDFPKKLTLKASESLSSSKVWGSFSLFYKWGRGFYL